MRKQQTFILAVFLILAVACFDDKDQKVIASVYGNDLLLSEIMKEMPKATEDSSFFVERYINLWIRKQLMIYHAEINLSNDLLDYEQQIKEYRSSLLIYAYQQELINQNFDTVVSKIEIQNYYDKNKEELELKENIFQGRFVKTNMDAPKLDVLENIFRSEKEEDKEDLIEYCRQFASNYHLEDSRWIYFSKFAKKLPLEIQNSTYYLSKNKYYNYSTDSSEYFLFIKQYQIKGNTSPLSLVQEKIRKIILNRNKLLFLKQLEDELYQKAISDNKIKIYQ